MANREPLDALSLGRNVLALLAIENNKFVPGTAPALRLSACFGKPVNELFRAVEQMP